MNNFMCSLLTCLVTILLIQSTVAQTCAVPNSQKKDCGFEGITEQQCTSKGCCWVPVSGSGNIPYCFFKQSIPSVPFTSSELKTMFGYFMANINIGNKGGVVASPDLNTPGGSYYYHWERDGALSMNALMQVSDFSYYDKYMQNYVQWVLHVQSESDPHGIDVRTEPKYMLPNGEVFAGDWCRPQNDGPGLRAITLINYANALIQQGKKSYVDQYLWTSGAYNGGAIKYDLDWVVNNWPQNGCDLWEEVESNNFFWNRFTMKHSLVLAVNFADKEGDSTLAKQYANVATAINNTLPSHYNGNFVYESTNRQQDAAVINAFNDGYSNDNMYSPTDYRVASTIKTLSSTFGNSFPINQKDSSANIPGILYGRYPGDIYAGGNPWVLTTAALAELYYRGATQTLQQFELPEFEALQAWKEVLNITNLKDNEISVTDFATALTSAGDGVLYRIRYHVAGNNFHLSEQIDKNTGFEISATDLTWSYATVLKAMNKRNEATALLRNVDSSFATHPSFQHVHFPKQ